jgi:hypothetical protein
MELDDMLDKAKEMAKNVSDEQIDQAKQLIDDKVEDKYDGVIDVAAEQAKKLND